MIVIQVYCDPTTAPTLQNAYSSVAVTIIGSTTSIDCLPGYTSSNPGSQPYFTCKSGTATIGQLSGITYSCQRVFLKIPFKLLISQFCMRSVVCTIG